MKNLGKTPAQTHNAQRGVFFRATVYGGSGYADESRPPLLELARSRIPVQFNPVGPQSDTKNLLDKQAQATLEELKKNRVDLARSVFFQSGPASDFLLEMESRVKIGRTTFETDRIPDGWLERCQAMDEVWVPSQFNRETFTAAGVEKRKLRVVPEGVHTDVYRPGLEPLQIPQTRGFNFLSVFDWQDRKGYDVLLRAYVEEFKADEDVALILKITTTNHPDADPETLVTYFVERTLGVPLEKTPPIILISGYLSNRDLPRLYTTADAFVLPTRGEGWGRIFMEALACERPVIATRWSGQLDFLHDNNSDLIDLEGVVPVAPDVDIEMFAGHRWAQPSVDHLRQLMRHVHSYPEAARRKAQRGREEMVQLWDWSSITKKWLAEFERLHYAATTDETGELQTMVAKTS